MNTETVLVTGGAGFIGSHIADRLLSMGTQVVIVDNLSTGDRENVNPRATFYQIDLTDRRALDEIFKKHKIDYVIHEAAKINLNVMLEEPSIDVASSVLTTLNLLTLCVEHRVKKIIYASSVAVYGRPKKIPVTETDEPIPIYSYGIAKKCAEEYIKYFSDTHHVNYSILRYANVYGPRQPIYGEVGVIAIFTDKVVKGQPLTIYGDGNHLRDYIYIDDVVEATVKTLSAGDRDTFNVGCGKGVSVNEVFSAIREVAPESLEVIHQPERIGEIGKFSCHISKLQALGFSPKVALAEGIRRTLEHYRKNPRP